MEIGQRCRVWWAADEEWYSGKLTKLTSTGGEITYDDGDVESVEMDTLLNPTAVEWDSPSPDLSNLDKYDDYDPEILATNSEYTEDTEQKTNTIMQSSNSAAVLTSQLEAVLESINIEKFQQQQDDQEDWLLTFLEKQDGEREREWEDVEEAKRMEMESEVVIRANSPPSPLNENGGAMSFLNNFTKTLQEVSNLDLEIPEAEKILASPNHRSQHSKLRTPLSTAVRLAGDEGCALIQGNVLSAQGLPGDLVEVCNPLVKVLYVEGKGDNVMLRCKTVIHITDCQHDTREPVFEKGKFSLELVPPEGGEMEGDLLFGVYDVGVDGTQNFVGQSRISLNDLVQKGGGLAPAISVDKWLELENRGNKPKRTRGEVHVKVKMYMPARPGDETNYEHAKRKSAGLRSPMSKSKRKEVIDVAKTTGGYQSTYKQEKQKYKFVPFNAKQRLFKDRLIKMENERLQKRLDKMGAGGSNAKTRPFDFKLQEAEARKKEERRKKKELGGGKGLGLGEEDRENGGARAMNGSNVRWDDGRLVKMVDGDEEERGSERAVEFAQRSFEKAKKACEKAKRRADEGRRGEIKGGRLQIAKEVEARKRDLVQKKKEMDDSVRELEKQQHKYNEMECKADELRKKDLEGAKKYLDHVDLARACEREAKLLAGLRRDNEELKVSVARAESKRRDESRKVASLVKYVGSKSQKTISGGGEDFSVSKPLKDLDVTPENDGIKNVYDKLRARRDKAIEKVNQSKARVVEADSELVGVEEKLAVAKARYLDPEADQALAGAHREVSRLRTAVETLKLERKLGYQFVKQSEGDAISLREEVATLRAKEGRKREKIKKVAFERDASREEYNSWLRVDSAHELRNAMKVMENAVKILEKMDNLRQRAEQAEAVQGVRERLETLHDATGV
ncbi:hypothetical protein TrLO_g4730 [Triparma laevis f. longispina]|uniref:C2 domain-containing protein n=1 Tax=Triparma laevis f. longispina TaxID=1714387 RepID=A0A9W7FB93_9STRA|nr:hypothetical protein TrLO_g4730 [Triparma laevis f. longispina]